MASVLTRKLAEFERETFHDPGHMTVSQWAERNRTVVPPSPKPGRWQTPAYLREPMDAAGDPTIEEVTVMAAAQTSKTELLINTLGYFIDCDPGEMMWVSSRDNDAALILRQRIRPNLQATPAIARKMTKRKRDNKRDYVRFGRARLYMAGANSPAALASKPIRVMLLDELDKYPAIGRGGREGDSVSLARDRTITYFDRKIVKVSTPTTRGGPVWKEWETSDKRRYYVPCPFCKHFQELVWQNIRWPKDEDVDTIRREDLVHYECEACKGKIKHHQKAAMVEQGVWVPEGSRIENGAVVPNSHALHRGYHMSALISPWLTWAQIVGEWYLAQGDIGRLINFVNGFLGWIWEEQAEATRSAEFEQLVDKDVRDCVVPEWALVLTAGVDVGMREVHYVVRAWGAGERSVTLDVGRGDSIPTVAGILLRRIYHKSNGTPMQPRVVAWDSGYDTDAVYAIARRNPMIRPVKGQKTIASGIPIKAAKVERKPSGQVAKNATTIWHVDTTYYKDKIVRMLRAKPDEPGFWRVAADVPEEWFRHLMSEHKVYVRKQIGTVVPEWQKKPGAGPNHWLDAEVYCCAAADMIGVFSIPLVDKEAEPAPARQPAPTARMAVSGGPRRGSWVGNVRGRWR